MRTGSYAPQLIEEPHSQLIRQVFLDHTMEEEKKVSTGAVNGKNKSSILVLYQPSQS